MRWPVLDWRGNSAEVHICCFRATLHLRAAAERRSEGPREKKQLEAVVLEQFAAGLPSGTADWVHYRRPGDVEAAVKLAEDYMAVTPGGPASEGEPVMPLKGRHGAPYRD